MSAPPTGSSTDGLISTDPGEPQTAPVDRILVQRNRVVAKTAVAEMFGSWINGAMFIEARAVDRRPEPKGDHLAERREWQRVEHAPRLEAASGQ